jgi:hypothetical protein
MSDQEEQIRSDYNIQQPKIDPGCCTIEAWNDSKIWNAGIENILKNITRSKFLIMSWVRSTLCGGNYDENLFM